MTWKTLPRLAEIYIQNDDLTSALITLPANLPMIEETPINDEKHVASLDTVNAFVSLPASLFR